MASVIRVYVQTMWIVTSPNLQPTGAQQEASRWPSRLVKLDTVPPNAPNRARGLFCPDAACDLALLVMMLTDVTLSPAPPARCPFSNLDRKLGTASPSSPPPKLGDNGWSLFLGADLSTKHRKLTAHPLIHTTSLFDGEGIVCPLNLEIWILNLEIWLAYFSITLATSASGISSFDPLGVQGERERETRSVKSKFGGVGVGAGGGVSSGCGIFYQGLWTPGTPDPGYLVLLLECGNTPLPHRMVVGDWRNVVKGLGLGL
ncbi:hypothetical protein AXG93_2090s1060 [Marchantia polymorpha subsp. ruderalis]|uniref:Uncharacterized protein n=1 Tax=Marchantia polymorpha subsp. ruderalis TaxID=1480154 RepID=A0A176W8I8_MARPO|nr:hypothetical protein AXG93_2090s1060 [Marchantia polymorpha subsp. ruderalis]